MKNKTLGRWLLGIALFSIVLRLGLTVTWILEPQAPWARVDMPQPWAAVAVAIYTAAIVVCAAVGFLIARRHPGNAVGWILIIFPLTTDLGLAIGVVMDHIAVVPDSPLAGVLNVVPMGVLGWVSEAINRFGFALFGTVLFLVFPDGRLPSKRWRPFLWLTLLLIGVHMFAQMFASGVVGITRVIRPLNPFHVGSLDLLEYRMAIGERDLPIESLATWMLYLPAAGALVTRLVKSQSIERQQLKWVTAAAGFYVLAVVGLISAHLLEGRLVWEVPLPQLFFYLGLLFIPLACAVSVFRYRLYDIDVVLNKAFLFGALALFVTGAYAAISLVAGAALGDRGSSNLVRVIAMATVALVFAPVRDSTQRIADRLVYGARADAYDVLGDFARKISTRVQTEQVLPAIASASIDGTGGTAARVSLLLTDGSEREVTQGPEYDREPELALNVWFSGEVIGSIVVWKSARDPVRAIDRKFLSHLAVHAGPAFHNVRLTEELKHKVIEVGRIREEVASARSRIVSAELDTRRRTEGTIGVSVAPHLDSIESKLEETSKAAPAEAPIVLRQAATDSDHALSALRDIAHGLFPPLLADKGLLPALESQSAKLGGVAWIRLHPTIRSRRFHPLVELTAYAAAAEVMKVAPPVDVEVRGSEDSLVVAVQGDPEVDPVRALDADVLQSLSDRLTSLGGAYRVTFSSGRRWVFEASIPVGPLGPSDPWDRKSASNARAAGMLAANLPRN